VHFQPFFQPWGRRTLSQTRLPYIRHDTNITIQSTTKYQSNLSTNNRFNQILPLLQGLNHSNRVLIAIPVQNYYHTLASYFGHLTRSVVTNRFNYTITIKKNSHFPMKSHSNVNFPIQFMTWFLSRYRITAVLDSAPLSILRGALCVTTSWSLYPPSE